MVAHQDHFDSGFARASQQLLPGAFGVFGVFGVRVNDRREIFIEAVARELSSFARKAQAGVMGGLQVWAFEALDRCERDVGRVTLSLDACAK